MRWNMTSARLCPHSMQRAVRHLQARGLHQWRISQHTPSHSSTQRWKLLPGAPLPVQVSRSSEREALFQGQPQSLLQHVLPKGFPDSVSPAYVPYVLWTSLGSAASSAAGVMSMQALLHAVGAGSGAIPLAATIQWVLKDGLGQFGGMVFASMVSTKFDMDPKRWRLVSAITLEMATFLELITPLFPTVFLPLAALANAGKNIAWLSASATRAAIHQTLATSGNLADVTAKSGSQSIAASLAGTSLGITLSAALGSSPSVLLSAWAILASVHLTSIVKAMRGLPLPTLTRERADETAEWFIRSRSVPSPEETRDTESLLGKRLLFGPTERFHIHVNPPLDAHGHQAVSALTKATLHCEDLVRVGEEVTVSGRFGARAEAPEEDAAVKHEQQHKQLLFGFALWRESRKSLHLVVETSAPWWVVLTAHLAACRAEMHPQEAVEHSKQWALDNAMQYIACLESQGWWVGHPLIEFDRNHRWELARE
jgi:hypothetical protein